MKCMHDSGGGPCPACGADKRIAELEAENAKLQNDWDEIVELNQRLVERNTELEAENASLERENDHKHGLFMEACDERDEARAAHQIKHDLWVNETNVLARELREARAACAAKDELIREAVRQWFEPEHDGFLPPRKHWVRILEDALSSTAGSDLLARLEKWETNYTKMAAAWESEREEAAKLKGVLMVVAGEEHRAKKQLREEQARLEATRAALWGFDYNPDGGARGYFCGGCDLDGEDRATSKHHDSECERARQALSPSAPRAYRNAVLEEAARHFDQFDGYPAFHVRALKDPECLYENGSSTLCHCDKCRKARGIKDGGT